MNLNEFFGPGPTTYMEVCWKCADISDAQRCCSWH